MKFTLQVPGAKRSDGAPARILTADPDARIRSVLDAAFRRHGWQAFPADDGTSALQHLHDVGADVVVTEIGMPDLDGLVLLGKIRVEYPDVPLMVLSAVHDTRNRIASLYAGADDYVTKPFDLTELVLRINALLRRRPDQAEQRPPRLVVGDLELDEESREVIHGGSAVHLTETEFRLLHYLMCNPHRVLSKAQILSRVWSHDFRRRESIVELYISYLRRKLDHRSSPRIHTVRGIGYVLRPS
jgi:DNA-binding response OmpR family regulator